MQFRLQKTELKQALANVGKSIALKSTIKALEGVLITISQGQATLTAYDLLEGITTVISSEGMDEGKFIIQPKLLIAIIAKLPTEDINFVVDDNSMTINSGKVNFSLPVQSAEEYPNIPTFENSNAITLQQDTLKSMIMQTVYCVAQNDTKPILTGELFEITDNQLNVVAIDGYRLAVRTEPITAENIKTVIPASALNKVAGILTTGECSLAICDKHAIFKIGEYTIFTRLLEGEFHNYKQSIPTANTIEVIADSKLLIDSLERCNLLTTERIKSPVKCTFADGQINISLKTAVGKINDIVPAEIIGGDIEIGFNARYMLDALKATDGGKVNLLLTNANKPMTIQGDNYTMLVLPVRLKNEE